MGFINVLEFCSGEALGAGIPDAIGNLVHAGFMIIQIVVPILLILWGMLDFAKGIMQQDEKEIKAGQKKFIQRLIAAVAVFLVVTIVNLVINVVAGLGDNNNTNKNTTDAWKCAQELINGKPGS